MAQALEKRLSHPMLEQSKVLRSIFSPDANTKRAVPSESVRSRALHKSPGASHCFHLFLGAVWRSGLLSKAWFVMEDDVIHTMLGERD